jgi:hypothetical protein
MYLPKSGFYGTHSKVYLLRTLTMMQSQSVACLTRFLRIIFKVLPAQSASQKHYLRSIYKVGPPKHLLRTLQSIHYVSGDL